MHVTPVSRARYIRHGYEPDEQTDNDMFESCTRYGDHWTRDRNIVMTATGVTQNLDLLQRTMTQWFPPGDEAR